MDLGDWQELSRLRFENHAWHRCVAEILEAIHRKSTSPEALTAAIEASIGVLNEELRGLHRPPVVAGRD
jgi:hypothetical protein